MYWSFLTITPIQWAILAAIFAVLGVFMPRRIPLTVCGAALVTALTLFVSPLFLTAPLSVLWQLGIFLGSIAIGLFFIRPHTTTLERFPEVQAVFSLTTPIQKGKGVYTHEDITYTLVGPDAPIGAQATIVSMKGRTLYIDILSQ